MLWVECHQLPPLPIAEDEDCHEGFPGGDGEHEGDLQIEVDSLEERYGSQEGMAADNQESENSVQLGKRESDDGNGEATLGDDDCSGNAVCDVLDSFGGRSLDGSYSAERSCGDYRAENLVPQANPYSPGIAEVEGPGRALLHRGGLRAWRDGTLCRGKDRYLCEQQERMSQQIPNETPIEDVDK